MSEQAQGEGFAAVLRTQLPLLAERYSVRTLGVFGSRLRGDAREDSDLDVLVTFDDPPGLIRFMELENHLSDLLGVKVDLVMKSALKPRIGERVQKEVMPV